MDLWIVISIAAALFQTVRFMLQKQLSLVQLSAAGATFARFVYSAPILCALLAVWLGLGEARVALPTAGFWAYGAIGGAAQITATVLTVLLFKRRNFAVGVTFIKVEVVMTALVGMVVLGDKVSLPGLAAILIGVAGVLVLSGPQVEGNILNRLITPSAALGLAAGGAFRGLCGVLSRREPSGCGGRPVPACACDLGGGDDDADTCHGGLARLARGGRDRPGFWRMDAGRVDRPYLDGGVFLLVHGLHLAECGLRQSRGAGGADLCSARIGVVLPRAHHAPGMDRHGALERKYSWACAFALNARHGFFLAKIPRGFGGSAPNLSVGAPVGHLALQLQEKAFFVTVLEEGHGLRRLGAMGAGFDLGEHHLGDERQVEIARFLKRDPLQV